MHQWTASHTLDRLCNFPKRGGFPIALAFPADVSRSELLAAAARPEWPGVRDRRGTRGYAGR
jgi:hypothetical protein